ncbi:protein-tyrosine-phosphatase [Malassezia yamatoensis]|uniref:protein-tyrosine-phosphatase n=1 Tax=Malassezia yamatoensis TaxID=253288 RepID=A0AAJ6CIG7_9BASI|nr:protein-tyrosine-phosphatase [Malassezia yamatoensis]
MVGSPLDDGSSASVACEGAQLPPDYFTISVPGSGQVEDPSTSPEIAEAVVPVNHPWAAMLAPPSRSGRSPRTPLARSATQTPFLIPQSSAYPPVSHHHQSTIPSSSARSPMPVTNFQSDTQAASANTRAKEHYESPKKITPNEISKSSQNAPNPTMPRQRAGDSGRSSPLAQPPALHCLPKGALAARGIPMRLDTSSSQNSKLNHITSISCTDLIAKLQAKSPVLIVDIRPGTAFARRHIRGSVNLCAPSTLLKRKEFTLSRLESQLLDSEADRERVQRWKSFPKDSWIVALDTDAVSATSVGRSTSGGGGPCLLGLLEKFHQENYQGNLCWLHGGFARLQNLPQAAEFLVKLEPCNARAQSLPSFSPDIVQPRGLSLDAFRLNIGQDGNADTPSQASNPFFDNIRQNLELACGITDIVPLEVGQLTSEQLNALPLFLRKLLAMPSENRAKHLAELFFQIEKSEQDRLRNVMQTHSNEFTKSSSRSSAQVSARAANPHTPTERAIRKEEPFPLSISAAVERGMENRYRNLWTFEHSRVKLSKPIDPADPGSNYLNASFVNPLRYCGEHKVYIATQAPLPATMLAFWEAVWEQGVIVVLMLAREFEAGRLQCHNYWEYAAAHFRVQVHQHEPLTRSSVGLEGDNVIATKRILSVTRGESTRYVTQFQYLNWPDHSVPDSADELLALSALANEAQGSCSAPLLVHCSAGIGRSGAHITIDSVVTYLKKAKSIANHSTEHTLSEKAAHNAWHGTDDVIFEVLSVIREQRMSMVQTVRQYVFIYRAIIEALASKANL